MNAKIEEIISNIQKNSNKENTILYLPMFFNFLYLIDWKHTIDFGRPITNATRTIQHDNTFSPISKIKYDFDILEKDSQLKLSENEVNTINFVINTFESKNKKEIARLIISTYPFIKYNKGEEIDLNKCAEEYNQIKNQNLSKIDRVKEERFIKTKIAFYHRHKKSVEVIFKHRMEIMPHTKKQCIRHIEKTKRECDKETLKLQNRLKSLTSSPP